MKNNIYSRRKFILHTATATAALTVIPRHVLGGKGYVSPSDKINIGFIGTGKLMRGIYDRFADLPEVMILAACDVDKVKLNRFKEEVQSYYAKKMGKSDYIEISTYKMFEELLEREDINAVVVGTPDHWHAIPSIAAMKAGKDVYCEKPMAHTIKEGRAMVNAARKYNRVLQTGSMQRSWDDFRRACELVINGYVGEIKKVLVNVGDPARPCDLEGEPVPGYLDWNRWVGPAQMRPYSPLLSPPIEDQDWPRWRDYREFGGGGVADWGAHMFDVAQWALEMDNSGPVKFIPPEDLKATRGLKMYYKNGIEMVHEDFQRGWAVRFIGSEGSLDISRSFLDSKPESIAQQTIKDSDKRLYFSDNHYADWIKAIKDRTKPVADVEIGHRTASICNIVNLAYQLGRPLEWDPEKEKFIKDSVANKLRTKQYRKPYSL